MSAWTATLRPGLPLSFDGERFTVAEVAGRRVLLQRASDGRAPVWRQVDVSVLLSHPSTQILMEVPAEEPAAAARLGWLSDEKDDELTVRVRHVQEVLTGYHLGSSELALEGEPRPDYAPGVPMQHRYTAKAAELGVGENTVRRWVAAVQKVRAGRSGERAPSAQCVGPGGSTLGGDGPLGAGRACEIQPTGAQAGPAGDRGAAGQGAWP
ncbi:hypothetical protein [Streptomyces sp. NBC_01092]|uniref:hypothetical protein n=1 Tax=Streptomyces sp. NBC_01092 TaxID=2903748 RepID=UPI00386A71C0|nr:hypothetical protein OG254_00410 [Streptomyces sp. NBC_01092]